MSESTDPIISTLFLCRLSKTGHVVNDFSVDSILQKRINKGNQDDEVRKCRFIGLKYEIYIECKYYGNI